MSKVKDLNKFYRKILRRHIDKKYQKNIKNKECSIISMNCVGGGSESRTGIAVQLTNR